MTGSEPASMALERRMMPDAIVSTCGALSAFTGRQTICCRPSELRGTPVAVLL